MQKIALLSVAVAAMSAWAGEHCIGLIAATDGGSVSNATTGYGSAGCAITATNPCGCAQAFRVGVNQKVTIQSDVAMIVGADIPVDAGTGLVLVAAEKFPSSTAVTSSITALPDGGTYVGGLVWCTPTTSTGGICRIFSRSGTE